MSDTALENMSGIEFEDLCYELLRKMNFRVRKTAATGDGGIDLIAYTDEPIISGKYIIQCKCYAGSVGSPIIRDLYGVVMSERANKGVLITTGYFTSGSKEFAIDKNIELIDGSTLRRLLDNYEILEKDVTVNSNDPDALEFNYAQYNFYSEMIQDGTMTRNIADSFICDFMYSYFLSLSHTKEVPFNKELSKDYERLCEWWTTKYYRQGDELKIQAYYTRQYKGIAQLYNFDIYDYIKDRIHLIQCGKWIKIRCNYNAQGNSYKISTIPESAAQRVVQDLQNENNKFCRYEESYQFYEVMSVYSLCSYFSIDSGTRVIYAKLLDSSRNEGTSFTVRKKIIELNHEFSRACRGPYANSYLFKTRGKKNKYEIDPQRQECVELMDFFESNIEENAMKIESEKDQIRRLFQCLVE